MIYILSKDYLIFMVLKPYVLSPLKIRFSLDACALGIHLPRTSLMLDIGYTVHPNSAYLIEPICTTGNNHKILVWNLLVWYHSSPQNYIRNPGNSALVRTVESRIRIEPYHKIWIWIGPFVITGPWKKNGAGFDLKIFQLLNSFLSVLIDKLCWKSRDIGNILTFFCLNNIKKKVFTFNKKYGSGSCRTTGAATLVGS